MANRYHDGPVTDHFDGKRFFNPGQATTDRSLAELLRWKLGGRPARWPTTVPVAPAIPDARVDRLRVTMVGHASLLVQIGGLNILTDPVWSDRASPFRSFGPKRVTVPGIAFEALPPIDAVLLSHNHYDHLDIATLRRLQTVHQPLVVAPMGNDAIVRAGVPGMRVVAADWGERVELGGGVHTDLVPAIHWSARGIGDRRMALWAGHMIRAEAGLLWFAGDTAYGDGTPFRAIRERHGAPDIALIPIGAYAPRWFMSAQHADPAEAVRIHRDIGAARSIGIHWGSFQLTDEPREEPRERLAAALAAAGIAPERFVAAEPGAVFERE
jgi:L-ascorbate metabolism protein UlaG (beta-lactamase superfamily)